MTGSPTVAALPSANTRCRNDPPLAPSHGSETLWTVTSENQLVIRPVEPSEHDAVAAVLVEAYTSEWGSDGWSEYREEMTRVGDRARESVVLVAVRDGAIIGTVTLVPPASPLRSLVEPAAGELRLLAVRKSEQRRGVGQLLIAAASSAARRMGLTSLVLQCDEDLAAAHHLYRGLGFERAEEHDNDVGGGYRALGYRAGLTDGTSPDR